ncbi:hypothetical protein EW146_g517 [Bondarzewia mesenterica]|uniref:F-box domain-containing protein n=1 Tax=Bondarzewia mesenterica TaxID=1095465 RepID=A0A4V3XGD0_9AGAM|nr:hypothetical protein EW146_g517 [Bondarzewia mesenterica]
MPGIFNPKMLDASIRDVVSSLTNDQKTDVLLYAMQHMASGTRFVIPFGLLTRGFALGVSSRTIIENAVQSCLQLSSVYPQKVVQARLLRAKSRFTAGLRGAAHQDLQAILLIDANHPEARALMPQAGGSKPEQKPFAGPHRQPRFSPELWREIASYLPRRDLKNLLWVPHALSSIASELLFRKIHIQLGTAQYYSGSNRDELDEAPAIDRWHAQRSADILTRIISDSKYASMVRHLVISAPQKEMNVATTFQIGEGSRLHASCTTLWTNGLTSSKRDIGKCPS